MLNLLGSKDVFSPNLANVVDESLKLIRYFSWHGCYKAQDVVVCQAGSAINPLQSLSVTLSTLHQVRKHVDIDSRVKAKQNLLIRTPAIPTWLNFS
jgi:hypothetical protein